jgi:hypothetical protein
MFICLFLFSTSSNAQVLGRNSIVAGADIRLGLFTTEGRSAVGLNVHGGYDIYLKKIPFLSIEPRIGVGFYSGSNSEKVRTYPFYETDTPYKYSISCFTIGISPKLYWDFNNDSALFMENEFSIMNMFANIKDNENISEKRQANQNGYFYYSGKIGLMFGTIDKTRIAVWLCGSTIKFDKILNKKLSADMKKYSGETISLGAGIDFYF